MNKRVAIIAGMAAVIALSGGVIALIGGSEKDAGTKEPTSAYDSAAENNEHNDDMSDDVTEAVETDPYEEPDTEEPVTEPSDDGEGDDPLAGSSYSIVRVVDHTIDSEVTPREVFGKMYGSCYLSFESGGRFSIMLNPSSGEVREGSYKLYGDVISVEYDNGAGSEFDVQTDDSANIVTVMVSYGDYDVYFG